MAKDSTDFQKGGRAGCLVLSGEKLMRIYIYTNVNIHICIDLHTYVYRIVYVYAERKIEREERREKREREREKAGESERDGEERQYMKYFGALEQPCLAWAHHPRATKAVGPQREKGLRALVEMQSFRSPGKAPQRRSPKKSQWDKPPSTLYHQMEALGLLRERYVGGR